MLEFLFTSLSAVNLLLNYKEFRIIDMIHKYTNLKLVFISQNALCGWKRN